MRWQVRTLRAELSDEVAQDAPTLEGLLSIRGMLEAVDDTDTEVAVVARITAMVSSEQDMLDALANARGAEGAQLGTVLDAQLVTLTDLVERAMTRAAAQPEALRTRLETMVSELLDVDARLPEDRLAQEAALLVGKADSGRR